MDYNGESATAGPTPGTATAPAFCAMIWTGTAKGELTMSASRLACLVLAGLWPLAAGAQLVVRDVQGPALPNPAAQVPYPAGVRNCNNTIADIGARAVFRAIDSCPSTVYESRQAYLSYAKQAVLGLTIPGATAAAGAMATEKAAENAFFCITGALIDESGANDADKTYLKALVAAAKENLDRADLAKKLLDLRQGFIEKGVAPYLNQSEANTFVQTLDATLTERYEGRRAEIALNEAGAARNDTPETRASNATEQARALARDCRFADADNALAQAQQANLAYLAELRADVTDAKHHRYCIETSAQKQRLNALDPGSPYLRNSLLRADADIAEADRRDAEQTRFIGQIAELHRSVRARRNDVEVLKQRAARQLEAARKAAGECDWSSAASALQTVGTESLECALLLDDERRARDEVAAQIEQLKQQLGQLEVEQANILATRFEEVSSCGQYSLVADNFNAIQGQCRVLANIDAKVAALRARAQECADFKAAALVQNRAPPPATRATISIDGTWLGNNGVTYYVAQSGMSFTWTLGNRPDLSESGQGSLTEAGKVNASWTNSYGTGRADGTAFGIDSTGRATRITWSNGVVFERN